MIDETVPPQPSGSFFATWSIATLATYVLVGSTAQFLHLAWGLWFSEVLLFAGATVIGLQAVGFAPGPALGLTGFEGRSFGVGLAFGAVNYVAWAVPLMALAQALFPKSLVERFDSSRIFERHSQVEVAIAIAGATLAAPICEEIFFRGFLQRGFREPPRGIVWAALIFSAFHFDPVGFLARFELGVLFGLLVWKAGSVWPAIGAHMANNGLSTILFYAAGEDADQELHWAIPLGMFVVGNVALLALARFTTERLPVSSPASWTPVTPGARLTPWLVGAVASIVVLVAVDWRGVALNVLDAQYQPSEATRNHAEVKALRARARSGEVPMSDYEAVVRQSAR